jgi:uncharacterized protein (TIGR02679 family)
VSTAQRGLSVSADGAGDAGIDRYRGPEYARLLASARRSLERTGGDLSGRVSVPGPDDAERRAIIGITGVHQPAGTGRLTVALSELDTALRRATGLGLHAALDALGGPLRDRPGEAASLASARAGLAAAVRASPLHDSCAWYREWLAGLVRDGTLTRLARQGEPAVLAHAVRVLEHLTSRDATVPTETVPTETVPVALAELAAQVTGDTKALNHPATLSTLVLRALALRAGTGRPASAAERRDLWDLSSVVVDDLSSRVLVLGLSAHGQGLGEWLTGAASYGTPFQVTLHQLVTHPIEISHPRVFVCENPAVLRRACAELGSSCPPLVCTEGRPSTAFRRLARLAVAGGGELWYHGDFDWPGVSIAADVIARHGARPWRMTAADYRSAAAANGGHVPLAGDQVPTPWDPVLAEAMCATGRAIYEETVADHLLADLARYSPG